MPYRDDVEALESRCKTLEAEAAQVGEELASARQLLAEAQAQRKLPVLDNIRIAAPCTARWDGMTGDERVRFCSECGLNVYNLSALTRAEATALVAGKEGRLCARYFRRADGTVLTTDCAVGVRRRRRRLRVAAVALAAVGAAAGVAGAALQRPVARAVAGETAQQVQPTRPRSAMEPKLHQLRPHVTEEMGVVPNF